MTENIEKLINKVKYIDCREGLRLLPDDSVDHFYADPPFDIDFKSKESMYRRDKGFVINGYNEPSYYCKEGVDYYEFSKQWLEQCFRVLKLYGTGWVCSGWSNLKDVLMAIDDVGFHVINHVIWKYSFGVYTKHKFVTSHYHLLFVSKGNKDWYFDRECRFLDKRNGDINYNYRDREDVWKIDRDYSAGKDKNANTQPLELLVKVLLYTTEPDNIVLDPFMGGGTTAAACAKLGRNYIGFEINKKLKPFIKKGIEKARKEGFQKGIVF